MATGSRGRQASIQPVSQYSRAATGEASAPSPADARKAAQTLPLPRSVPGHPDSTWKHTYPGTWDQLTHARVTPRPLLRDRPMAGGLLLILHNLFVLASGSISSRVLARSLSYLSARSSCKQRRISSLPAAARQATEADLRASSPLVPVPRRPLGRMPVNSGCYARHGDRHAGELDAGADTHNRSGRPAGAVIAQLKHSADGWVGDGAEPSRVWSHGSRRLRDLKASRRGQQAARGRGRHAHAARSQQ
jgi:hypothetical protein